MICRIILFFLKLPVSILLPFFNGFLGILGLLIGRKGVVIYIGSPFLV